jgi:hypothetical protein
MLRIGEDTFNPETIRQFEAFTDHLVVPREAMGLGRCQVHGSHWRLPGLASGVVFVDG